jgi:hypothetical protein
VGGFALSSMRSVTRMPELGVVRVISRIALVSLLLPAPAHAATAAQIAAEAFFREGVSLMQSGQCGPALEKFEESKKLEPASGTLLDIAYCQVRLGRVASAWSTYREVIPLAREQHKPQHEQLAREQADKLEPQLPRLTLVATGTDKPTQVTLDGEALPDPLWSAPFPVDPGAHQLSMRLADGRTWEKTITLGLTERASIEVPSVAAPAPIEARVNPDPGVAVSGGTTPPLPEVTSAPLTPSHTDDANSRPTWALVLGISGGAVLATGGVLLASARAQYDDASSHCGPSNQCQEPYYGREHSAISRANLALGLAAGGVVMVGVGAVVYFATGKTHTSSLRVPVVVAGGPGECALGWQGTW